MSAMESVQQDLSARMRMLHEDVIERIAQTGEGRKQAKQPKKGKPNP
jgi:hypothetical protein